jgi:NAD-dependent dihydropyrimidine dehydrogenase PreA subunit
MKYLSNVVTLELFSDKCVGCGMCVEVCPHGVFEMQDGKAVITDRDKCMECGACSGNCAYEAIKVDKGVGCATALINAMITGGEATCDCGGGSGKTGCC